MDVSSFLTGNFLTHLDLPTPSQTWTVRAVKQQLVGSDPKICIWFNEHQKPLGLNKTNLRTIADRYSVESAAWVGKSLELYKDRCQFQSKTVDCVRVRIPSAPEQTAPPVQPSAPQPATAIPPQPVAPPAPAEQQEPLVEGLPWTQPTDQPEQG